MPATNGNTPLASLDNRQLRAFVLPIVERNALPVVAALDNWQRTGSELPIVKRTNGNSN